MCIIQYLDYVFFEVVIVILSAGIKGYLVYRSFGGQYKIELVLKKKLHLKNVL